MLLLHEDVAISVQIFLYASEGGKKKCLLTSEQVRVDIFYIIPSSSSNLVLTYYGTSFGFCSNDSLYHGSELMSDCHPLTA